MHNINIGRYRPGELVTTRVHCDADGNEVSREEVELYGGFVEGTGSDGNRWIMWLDPDSNPLVFWPQREADGAVIGDPIDLQPPGGNSLADSYATRSPQ